MVALDAGQVRTMTTAMGAAADWCTRHPGTDWDAVMLRTALVWWTESRCKNLANDGLAFADNAEEVRPGWAEGVPLTMRAQLRRILRESLTMPNDGVGNNGGSTGGIQQLSQEYVGARFPGAKWGYGTVADTMDPAKTTVMFLDRLIVTNDPVYAGIRFSDPATADVLRVQQPKVSEHSSDNYSATQVVIAQEIVDQIAAVADGDGTSLMDWIRTMATTQDQSTLDEQWERIKDKVVWWKVNNQQSLADYLANFRSYISVAVKAALDPVLSALADSSRPFQVIRDKGSRVGACYLVGPNTFRWVSGKELEAWKATKLVGPNMVDVEHAQVLELAAAWGRSDQNGRLYQEATTAR